MSKMNNESRPKSSWSIAEREEIQFLMREYFSIQKAAEKLGISRYRLSEEVERGTTEQEYKERRYAKYDVDRAIESEARTLLGEENYNRLKEIWIRENEKK